MTTENNTQQEGIDAIEAVMQSKIMQRAELMSVSAVLLSGECTGQVFSRVDTEFLPVIRNAVQMAKLLIEEVNQQFVD